MIILGEGRLVIVFLLGGVFGFLVLFDFFLFFLDFDLISDVIQIILIHVGEEVRGDTLLLPLRRLVAIL